MDFSSLLKLANKQTAASQTELAAKEAARLAQLKADQIATSKRTADEKRLADERRALREERERKARDEEERRLRELPKTRNLWQLKQERIKRGLNPDGSEDYKLADAEKKKPSKPSGSGGGAARGDRSATNSPRPQTRAPEDKAAARKRRMFKEDYDDEEGSGSMALLRAFGGPNRSVSPAGSRSRHDSPAPRREQGGKSASAPANGRAPAPAKPTDKGSSIRFNHSGSSTPASSSTAGMSAKDRLKAGLGKAGSNLIALNKDKRDTRTIDEIERDMRKKKEEAARANGTALPSSHPPAAPSKSSAPAPAGSTSKRPASESSYHRASSKKPRPDERKPTSSRHRPASDSEDESDFCSSGSDEEHYRHRNARQSDLIWKIMGRDRKRDMARDVHSDDDDMEVSAEQQWREDQRAARLAAKEDEAERLRLERAAEDKRRRLKGK